jgi:hypothetical protein
LPSADPSFHKKGIDRFLQVLQNQNWGIILLLVALTIALSTPIYYRRILVPVDTDYGSHISHAEAWLRGQGFETLTPSHPLLQFTLIAMRLASRGRLSLYTALIIVQVVVQVATALILYFWFGQSDRPKWDILRGFAALSLTFVAPVMLLAALDGLFYFGYIGMANYHNPTVHMLKPLALLSAMHAFRAIEGQESSAWKIALAALWIILSAWVKPSYALSILPALALCAVIRWYLKQQVDMRMLVFGFFVPAALVLAAQWLIIVWRFGEPSERIILAPFAVESAFSDYLFLKIFLSSAFPIVILWLARRSLLTDARLLVGWTGFLSGAAQLYLLAEGGERLLHGNFRWSAQIMLFLLFAITLRWLLQEGLLNGSRKGRQRVAAWCAYLAHLGGGIVYYSYCMISVRYG